MEIACISCRLPIDHSNLNVERHFVRLLKDVRTPVDLQQYSLMPSLVSGLKNLLKSHHISPAGSPSNSPPSPSHHDSASSAAATQASSRRSRDQPRQTEASTSTPQTTAPQQQPANTTTMNQPANNNVDQAEALVRREKEAKAKRDQQPFEGLPDGITLGIKMGDGAFSNVFQATLRPNAAQLAIDPTLGKAVKVAVKCVRKYELNHSQVRNSFILGLGRLPVPQQARRSEQSGHCVAQVASEGRHRCASRSWSLSRSVLHGSEEDFDGVQLLPDIARRFDCRY